MSTNGDRNQLKQFTQFRLSNAGLLLARVSAHARWITLVAYCGGDKVDDEGRWIGYCLNYPLVFGREKTCPVCGKPVCGECGFCTETCRERQRREQERLSDSAVSAAPPPPWVDEIDEPGYWVGLDQWGDVETPPDDDVPWSDAPPWWDDDRG